MSEQANNTSQNNNQKVPTLWGWHTWLSIAITVVILLCLAAMLDLREIWREVAASDKKLLLLGALAHYATYPVRGLRWRRCLIHLPLKAGAGKFGVLVFFYNFVDNVVPAKLGDVYGAHLARINCGIRRSAAMGSLVFLRVVDAWVLLLLASVASWILFSSRLLPSVFWSLIGGGIIAVIATSLMLTLFLFKKSLPGWLPEKVHQMIHAFHTGMWPRPSEIVPIVILTAIIWVLETSWILLLTLAFGLTPSAAEVVFLTMIPLLASAFPFTPSGAGVVEVTLFSCLRLIGVAAPTAVSVTVANRFIDYWLHIGLGLVTWAIRRSLGLRTWREVPIEDFQQVAGAETSLNQKVFHEG
ncbi:MAG: flippase-like domain-containing protein [Deltaproteobacteria bacterium]|nr:MAG: flippase-like domain-containing protein [Deltaproteobacteria bacterium]